MKIFHHLSTIVYIALTLIISTGCGGNQAANIQKIDSEIKKDSKTERLNNLLLKSGTARNTDPNADYTVGHDDLIEIDVFQAEELRRTVRVSAKGYIGLPLIGQIKAKGQTPVQIEEAIAKRLVKYMQEPLVTVYIKEYRAQRIGVIGAVTQPQVYAVTGQKYLLDMLSMAGGLTREAGAICYILRPQQDSERQESSTTETMVIDLTELLEKGNIALNIPVFGGDVINVPKGGVVFVDGAVSKPGSMQMQGKTTLVQAIAMAGGMLYEADVSDVKIFRDNGEGFRDIITTDYDAIKDGKKDDIQLRENDIIIVPKSGVKTFLTGVLNTVRGFISFGKSL
ncbi:MAG: polysaccharide biosynthesis/export family protein [Nitrospirae bacterium]|nr:polysaccharide biosynthesis/export family protein [Nitrospirota bacterium]